MAYDLGNTIKEHRIKMNLTQKKLPDRIDVTEATISRYESNTQFPPIETLRSLAAIFNISLDTLCGMQQNGSMSMHGLTESQRQLVEALAETFRDRNRSIKKDLTEQQYALLGKIIAELQK